MKNFFHRRFFVNLQSLISLFFLLSIHKTSSSSSIYSTPLRMQLTRTHWHHHRLVFFPLLSLSFLRHIFFIIFLTFFFASLECPAMKIFTLFWPLKGFVKFFVSFLGIFCENFHSKFWRPFSWVSEREKNGKRSEGKTPFLQANSL